MTNTDPTEFTPEDTQSIRIPVIQPLQAKVQPELQPEPQPFLTPLSVRVLNNFSVSADSRNGVELRCQDNCLWSLPWPAHVLAPDLRHLAMLAERHWLEVHQ